jgi:hypothetical protein
VRAVLDELWDTSLESLKKRAEQTTKQRGTARRAKSRPA